MSTANADAFPGAMRNFREYDIWKRSIKLVKEVYHLTDQFPSAEKYGLSSQIQRAVVSIGSNVAEGAPRKLEKEFNLFLQIAQRPSFEEETQLIIAQKLGYLHNMDLSGLFDDLHILQKQIKHLTSKLK